MILKKNYQTHPKNNNKLNLLENEKLGLLFAKLAIPLVFAMMINGLYNLVDAYFVLHYVGAQAFAAVSAVFPFQLLIIALAALVGNGVSILLSLYWGGSKFVEANQVINNAISIIFTLSISLFFLAYLYIPNTLSQVGITKLLLNDALAYLTPIMSGAILVLALSLISDILRAQSNMTGLLLIILLGAISNIILDYLFIVVLNMGVFGAALATLTGQLLGVLMGLKILFKNKGHLKTLTLHLALNLNVIKKIIGLALPVFISYLGAALIMILINTIIADQIDSEIIVASYGIISRINIFIILPLIAISQASQNIIAHNYGAKKNIRVQQATVTATLIASGYLSLTAIILYLFSGPIIGIFTNITAVIYYSQSIANIMFLVLPISGVNIISVAFFQALGKAKLAILLSSAQVYIFLIPIILLTSTYFEFNTVWYAFPLTQGLSFLLAAALFLTQKQKLDINISYTKDR